VRDEKVDLPKAEILDVHLGLVSAGGTDRRNARTVGGARGRFGAQVSALDASQLEGIQPIAAADALRFLPGAVVSEAGRRAADPLSYAVENRATTK